MKRLLHAIYDIQALIRNERDEVKLLTATCNLIAELRGYLSVWVGYPCQDTYKVISVAFSGKGKRIIDEAPITWDDTPNGRGPCGSAIRERIPVVFNDIKTDPRFAPWLEQALATGCGSIASFPMLCNGEIIGAITVKAKCVNAFGDAEIDLLSKLAADIAYTIHGNRQHAKTEMARRESEEKYFGVFQNAPVLMTLSDLQTGRFLEVNDEMVRWSEFSREELIGKTALELNWWWSAKDRERVVKSLKKNKGVKWLESHFRSKNGRQLQCYYFGQIVGPDDKPQLLSIAQDVTSIRQTENTLNLLNKAIESSMSAVALADLQGRVAYVNPAYVKLWGYDNKDEMIGRSAFEFWADPENAKKIIAKAIKGHTEISERLAAKKDGSTFDVNLTVQLLRNSSGAPECMMISAADITERKKAERALRESEERLRTLINAAPDFICFKDGQGRWQEANQAAVELFDFSPDTCLGKTDAEFAATDDYYRESHLACIASDESAWQSGKAVRLEEIVSKADGTRRVFDVIKVPVFDEKGGRKALIILGRDITERRDTEKHNRRLMVAIDQAAESIVFSDLKGNMLYVNQAFEKSSGYTREEALGQNPRLVKSGRQSAGYYKQMWDTLERGEVWSGNFTNKRKDGALYEEEATISPVRDSNGTVISYVAVKKDITREILLERQVVEAQKMEAVGLLAGGVAHDYNNILAANMLQLEIILDMPDLKPELREALKELQALGERGASLTRQLLMFSRRQPMQIRPTELGAFVANETALLHRLLGENIELIQRSSARPAWIEADAGMIGQVLMNLCINARDAMPKGGQITIYIKPVQIDAERLSESINARLGSFECLVVADTGCGMDESTKQQIFEPFFTTKELGKGTGLGLATVYGIIKQHKGWIEVDSAPGKGSEFRVYLPAIPAPAGSKADESKAETAMGKGTILIVEDDPAVQKTVEIFLKSKGYTVHMASSGREAFEQWRTRLEQIDLLIADMIMPGGMDGVELGEAFRKNKPELPVIIMSGYSPEVAQKGVHQGAGWSYVAKPCSGPSLTAAVRKALDEAKGVNEANR